MSWLSKVIWVGKLMFIGMSNTPSQVILCTELFCNENKNATNKKVGHLIYIIDTTYKNNIKHQGSTGQAS